MKFEIGTDAKDEYVLIIEDKTILKSKNIDAIKDKVKEFINLYFIPEKPLGFIQKIKQAILGDAK